jgi:glycosyltransferase involved in cell wall biosynthesis
MTRFLNVNALVDAESGGGTAERTFQLSRALADEGVDTTVLCLDIGVTAERRAALRGARVIAVPCVQKRYLVPQLRWDVLTHAVQDADIIQLTNHWTALNALVYYVARRIGKPWIVCPAGALGIFGRSVNIKRLYNTVVGRRIVQCAAERIAITSTERVQFEAYGTPARDVRVVPNGVAIEEFMSYDVDAFRRRCGIAAAPFILFMGRLNAIKGPDILLDAFCRVAPAFERHHLVFAGPDEGMQSQLERRAADAGLGDRVHFVGYVQGLDKSSAYRAADVVVVPSRREAMSIVALEAGACEKPVILTDQCGFDEVQSAGGGRVVPVDAEALAAALGHALRDEKWREESGKLLHELVRSRYTWNAAARRYIEIFDCLRNRAACAS